METGCYRIFIQYHLLVHTRSPHTLSSVASPSPFFNDSKKVNRSANSTKRVKRNSYYASKRLHYKSKDVIYVKKLDYVSSDSSDFLSSLNIRFVGKKRILIDQNIQRNCIPILSI